MWAKQAAEFINSSILFGAVQVMAEIPLQYTQRKIIQRQQRSAMYHPFTDALAFTLVDFPVTFFIFLLFSVVLYELVQLQQSAAQFL